MDRGFTWPTLSPFKIPFFQGYYYTICSAVRDLGFERISIIYCFLIQINFVIDREVKIFILHSLEYNFRGSCKCIFTHTVSYIS